MKEYMRDTSKILKSQEILICFYFYAVMSSRYFTGHDQSNIYIVLRYFHDLFEILLFIYNYCLY